MNKTLLKIGQVWEYPFITTRCYVVITNMPRISEIRWTTLLYYPGSLRSPVPAYFYEEDLISNGNYIGECLSELIFEQVRI